MQRALAKPFVLAVAVGSLGAGLLRGQAGNRTGPTESAAPRLVLRVVESGTGHPVIHPMVCIREFGQPLGANGDSLGWVSVGGELPNGTLHLRILAPAHVDADTTVAWPTAEKAAPIVVSLRARQGLPVEPRCPTR